MKKCMSGCGGKMMSKGGKVSPTKLKKMQPGGPLSTLGSKIGVGVNLAGMLGTGVKAIFDKIKEKNQKKKAVTEKNVSIEDVKRRGGAKYKSGGIAKQTIVGGPGYNANTNTMKMGGTASLPICKGSLVRMPDGSCGKRETTFKKGGNVSKLAKLAPPTNKVTRADVIAGALKNKRKKK